MLGVATRLGLTSFGGPVAHLGYFRAEYVIRRRWLDEGSYADLVALCQFLPGPASSQLGIAIGMLRAGFAGALAAWAGFTLPSAVALILFATAIRAGGAPVSGGAEGGRDWLAGALHGLEVVAVAVVAQAVWGMARSLCPDRPRATLAVLSAALVLLWPAGSGEALAQVLAIVLAALAGWRLLRPSPSPSPAAPAPAVSPPAPVRSPVAARVGVGALLVLALLLVALPLLRRATASPALAVFDAFFRTGALVFGGGHVVLPLLRAEVVPPGWVSEPQFVAGYGAAQAVPGPLFTFAAYLGATLAPNPGGAGTPGVAGVAGAAGAGLLWGGLALVAVFLPSFLLVIGALPFWDVLRRREGFRAALAGVNAAVVGLLLAALYRPVWTSAILHPADFALALGAFALLALWAFPPWLVVLLAAAGGALFALLGLSPGLAP